MSRTWPPDWEDRRRGVGCRLCLQRRPDRTAGGRRFFEGRYTDGYLRNRGPLPGYSMVVWRGRHVADPAEMSDDEARNYFSEVVEVGRLLNAVFQPAQLNYLTFGNSVPHVHTYLLPRYLDDPSPGLPLDPFTEVPVGPEIFAEQLALLQSQQEKRSG
ncbi:MAG: hypothetical protein QOH56_664 [Pseudonocardiales bacterium]|jgi:diadenosine tetraphosphate (Ap4A) HIT family hydrolase|nr:Histidine triad protein [Frankiales bacterium]MDQ1691848.1 hypothetical protein [Pseudonocardiales bacterium]MDQ1734413.1 hypothetical protein [Pseudonocardiales bacterium]